ncbi:TPA: hypothetical protein QHP34_002648 [Citrobacter braakii]|uniref:gas vesicle accessory protein GvpU n=1 Tax=Citrobacter braakii TaxID=57706 RepID=UPI0027E8C56B|nr:hypothetical protein [Citrobacter braakii]
MSEEKEISTVLSRKITDADLSFCVNIANKHGANLGVTLFCKGIIITGMIISGKEYYDGVADSFGPKKDGVASLGDYFRQVGDAVYSQKDGDEEQEFPNNFIHLKDVKLSAGTSGFTPYNNAFLRLKVEEIDGHIIGIASV